MFYVYIMTNKRNGTLYTGHTDDIYDRAHQHKTGQFPGFSKKYGCTRLVWFEGHDSREDAFIRERRKKNWRRRWKLELIEKDNPNWLDIYQLPVWPLPKGNVYSDLRRDAIRGDTGSRFSSG